MSHNISLPIRKFLESEKFFGRTIKKFQPPPSPLKTGHHQLYIASLIHSNNK
jgi:hypothetical protein